MELEIPVKRLREGARVPAYATPGAAGMDLYACLSEPMRVSPGAGALIPTGIALTIPIGYVGLVRDRSSLAIAGLYTVAGVIDSDYRGEIKIAARNAGDSELVINAGDRIAQMLLLPCPHVGLRETDELPATRRGEGGFGSTGR